MAQKPFYMIADGPDDEGAWDFNGEGHDTYGSIMDAIEAAKEDVEQNGGIRYVVACKPVQKVCRVEVKVEALD